MPIEKIFNKNENKQLRQKLRNSLQLPEIIVWNYLKNRSLNNLKFRRQYSINNYVVDFYCPELKLAIEIDGDSHFLDKKQMAYDKNRQEYIENFGIRVLRFMNHDVLKNIEGVLEKIQEEAEKIKIQPPPTPP